VLIMSGVLTPAGGTAIASGDAAATYGLVTSGLSDAGSQLAGLAERVRQAWRYVERCAAGVEQLADHMDGLAVDGDTIGEHHEAAAVMRSVLAAAEQMAAGMEDLADSFSATAEAHQGDYGSVAAAATSLTVPMAEAGFYSNR
jgi:hypothetical protein